MIKFLIGMGIVIVGLVSWALCAAASDADDRMENFELDCWEDEDETYL